jgi:hypothetical protein
LVETELTADSSKIEVSCRRIGHRACQFKSTTAGHP